jgi:class 3 adenylate cyclase
MPFAEHRRQRAVVFVQAAPGAKLRLLDAFTELAVVDALIRRTVERLGGDLVKSNGAIAIALFERDADAVQFALALEEELSANAPDARIAVARGEVFVFDLDRADASAPAHEIAGDPVNIASKLAEDSALTGILVDRSVSLPPLASRYATERYSLRLGAIALDGVRVTLR